LPEGSSQPSTRPPKTSYRVGVRTWPFADQQNIGAELVECNRGPQPCRATADHQHVSPAVLHRNA
jgi:hypothetical protein